MFFVLVSKFVIEIIDKMENLYGILKKTYNIEIYNVIYDGH